MLTWLIYGLLTLLACGLAIVVMTFASVRIMRGIELVPVQRATPAEGTWALSHGFSFIGSFETRKTPINSKVFSWIHTTSPTFFCVYLFGGQRAFDFVTDFERDVSLTTASSGDGQMFPRPSMWYQEALPGRSLDQLWAAHQDSKAFLVGVGGATASRTAPPFLESFVKECRRQMEFVSQIPFYPIRGLHWFLIRKRKFKNVSIRQQYGMGWIQLPRDLVAGRPLGESVEQRNS